MLVQPAYFTDKTVILPLQISPLPPYNTGAIGACVVH